MKDDEIPEDTQKITPQPETAPVGKSATWKLVDDIEELTKGGWTQGKRGEVADLIRVYRHDQTGSVIQRIQKLARESGATGLSEKIYNGKY